MNEKIAGAVIVAALALAFFTKPSREDHEKFIANHFANENDAALGRGEILNWLKGKTIDYVRSGQFESGVLSSTYYLTIAGQPAAKCLGYFGHISCSKPGK